MAQRTQLPKFGNWESEEIPYTICFDNARKSKNSDQIHQKDPQESIDIELKNHEVPEVKFAKHEDEMIRSAVSLLHHNAMSQKPAIDSSDKWHNRMQSGNYKSETEVSKASDLQRPRHDRRQSREEGDMRKFTDSPLRHEAGGLRNSSESPRHRHGGLSAGDTPRRVARQSVGSDRSVEHSPMHPHSQTRSGGRSSGVSSPAWERKATSEASHGLAPSTPGRSRLRSVARGDDTSDHGPAVPKFGDWDETDPATAEGYTHIFNRVREEKHSEAGKVPAIPVDTSYPNAQKQYENDNIKGCRCFPWGKR